MSPLNGPSPDRNSKNWGLINDNLLGRSLSGKAISRKSRIHSGDICVLTFYRELSVELRVLLASLAIRAVCLILGGFAVKGAWEVGTGWRVD